MAKAEEPNQISEDLAALFRRMEKRKAQRFYTNAAAKVSAGWALREVARGDAAAAEGKAASESLAAEASRKAAVRQGALGIPSSEYIK